MNGDSKWLFLEFQIAKVNLSLIMIAAATVDHDVGHA